jgi:hypothetical protein
MKNEISEKILLYKKRNKDGDIVYMVTKTKQEGTLLGSFKTYSEARHAMHDEIKKSNS